MNISKKAKGISIISIITILAIAGIVLLILSHQKSQPVSDAPERVAPELKVGRYYLDGDKSTDFYIEVFDDKTLAVYKEDLADYINKNNVKPEEQSENSLEGSQQLADIYSTRGYYAVRIVVGTETIPIFINQPSPDEPEKISGMAHKYIDENTIEFPNYGMFVYVEE